MSGSPLWADGLTAERNGAAAEPHPRDYLDVIRRRWWIVAVAVGAALFLGLRKHQQQIPKYSAEVLLQVHAGDPRLVDLGVASVPASALLDLSSELEIVRTHSRLALVVDSLGLRLQPALPREVRSRVIAAAEVDPAATIGSFVLNRMAETVRLTATPAETLVAEAAPGQWLEGSGVRLLPAPEVALGQPIPLVVLHPQDAVGRVQEGLRLEIVGGTNVMRGGTNLIRIRFTDTDPVTAAAVPNLLARIYRNLRAERAQEAVHRRVEFIIEQLAKLADSVEAAEVALMRYEQATGMLNPDVRAGAAAPSVFEEQRALRQIEFRRDLVAALVTSLQDNPADDATFEQLAMRASQLLPGGGREIYGRLQELKSERIRLTASRVGYAAQGPSVEVVDSLIIVARADLTLAAEQALQDLEIDLAAARERQQALAAELRTLPQQAMAYRRLERQLDAVQEQFSAMLGNYYEARIAEAAELNDVDIVDTARVPRAPDPSSKSPLVMALLLGLMVGVGGALGLDRLDTGVRRPDDVLQLGLGVIGFIPDLKLRANGSPEPAILMEDERSAAGEAFRMLRTTLRFVRVERPRVMAVTSTGPGEGKSVVAANLAVALAQQGGRILLVDADLRRPVQHRIFRVEREPGLADVVVGSVTLHDALVVDERHNVTVLPCGTRAPNPAELLGSDALGNLLQEARDAFDTVVVDTPPILVAADASVIGTAVDGTLLVAQTHRTDRRALASAVEHLRQVRAPVLGVVLNRVPPRDLYGRYRRYGFDYANTNGARRASGFVRRVFGRVQGWFT